MHVNSTFYENFFFFFRFVPSTAYVRKYTRKMNERVGSYGTSLFVRRHIECVLYRGHGHVPPLRTTPNPTRTEFNRQRM